MKAWKVKQIRAQGGVCPLSLRPFDLRNLKDAVVDHDHQTGLIRGVLSRSGNAVEGKVKNAVARWGGVGEDYPRVIAYLKRLITYLEQEPTPYIYPTHKTADELRLERNKKAREARAKRAARDRLKG